MSIRRVVLKKSLKNVHYGCFSFKMGFKIMAANVSQE